MSKKKPDVLPKPRVIVRVVSIQAKNYSGKLEKNSNKPQLLQATLTLHLSGQRTLTKESSKSGGRPQGWEEGHWGHWDG